MPQYSDISKDAFGRAIQSLRDHVPDELSQTLSRLLEEEELHDFDLVRQAIERTVEGEEPDAD